MGATEFVRHARDHWLAELAVVRAHPVLAPSDPPYQRIGVAYFFALGIPALAALVALIVLGDGSPWADGFTLPSPRSQS